MAEDTAAEGAANINALSLAFFSPSAMLDDSCSFADLSNAPCVKAAAGAGSSVGMQWILDTITATAAGLSKNTAPKRGEDPTIFISFGGLSEGGAGWDEAFSSASSAETFGNNLAALAVAVAAATNNVAKVGIDLDVEGMETELPYFGTFISAFRADAPYLQVRSPH